MKSSTLRRANLSREKLEVLETLAKYRRQIPSANTQNMQSGVPVKQIKERELDVLWNNYKQHSKQDKSPTVYLISGFVAGVIVTVIVTILIQMSVTNINQTANDITTKVLDTKIEDAAITFIPADKETVSVGEVVTKTKEETVSVSGIATKTKEEIYTVQKGDTLESIIRRFYGSYSKAHEKAVKEANKIENPNALSIGQKLIIPLH